MQALKSLTSDSKLNTCGQEVRCSIRDGNETFLYATCSLEIVSYFSGVNRPDYETSAKVTMLRDLVWSPYTHLRWYLGTR
jgi:hypothetical protein